MTRKVGYYKQYSDIQFDPVGVAPEIYIDRNGEVFKEWYLYIGRDRETSLNFKELVALRDALTKAIDDADAAVERERRRLTRIAPKVARANAEFEQMNEEAK